MAHPLKKVAKAIANREDLTEEHAKVIHETKKKHEVNMLKAKQAAKAKPAKKVTKNGKKGK